MGSEHRLGREAAKPRLAEVPADDVALESEAGTSELLGRLERQAFELGRLEGRAQILEDALKAERDARRRLAATLKRERQAAETLHERAQVAEAASASLADELEGLRQVAALPEQQMQTMRMQLADLERRLTMKSRPVWRRLLRRAPAH